MRQDQGGGRLGSFRIRESEKLFKFISDFAKLLSNRYGILCNYRYLVLDKTKLS